MKQKDNLTDLVERLPKTPLPEKPAEDVAQQVIGSDGEIITLEQKKRQNLVEIIHTKVIELLNRYGRS